MHMLARYLGVPGVTICRRIFEDTQLHIILKQEDIIVRIQTASLAPVRLECLSLDLICLIDI